MNTKTKKKEIETKKINISTELVNFRDIEESPINAQEMSVNDFNRLVDNLRRDGVLTTAPLLMRQAGKNKFMCISGHHRIRAAIKAKILQANCLIMDEVDESTRTRIQLVHNDIHGEPNKEILSVMISKLNNFDVKMVDNDQIENLIIEAKEVNTNVPIFKYINICLLDSSRDRFVDMLNSMKNEDDVNYLIEKQEYEKIKDLLTLAFEKGFKTAGQSIGVFMDIVDNHKDEIKR